jgi:hypothetical protein
MQLVKKTEAMKSGIRVRRTDDIRVRKIAISVYLPRIGKTRG